MRLLVIALAAAGVFAPMAAALAGTVIP